MTAAKGKSALDGARHGRSRLFFLVLLALSGFVALTVALLGPLKPLQPLNPEATPLIRGSQPQIGGVPPPVFRQGPASAVIILPRNETTDLSWLLLRFSDLCLQVADPKNGGMLRWLVQHYHNLPEKMLFINGERYPWGQEDVDVAALLRNFNWEDTDNAPQYGFLAPSPVDEASFLQARQLPAELLFEFSADPAFSALGQFFLTAKQVRKRPWSFYKDLLKSSSFSSTAADDSGLFFLIAAFDDRTAAAHPCQLVRGCSVHENGSIVFPTSLDISDDYRERISRSSFYACQPSSSSSSSSSTSSLPPNRMIIVGGFTGFVNRGPVAAAEMQVFEAQLEAATKAKDEGRNDGPPFPHHPGTGENGGRFAGLSWLLRELGTDDFAIRAIDKTTDPAAPFAVWPNRSMDAPSYLSFIVAHYDNLPASMVFLHGHKEAWHQTGMDLVKTLKQLDYSLDFAGLHRSGIECVCIALPAEYAPECRFCDPQGRFIAEAWSLLLEPFVGPRSDFPKILSTSAFSQFLVSRDNLRKLPRAFWSNYLNFSQTQTAFDRHALSMLHEHLWLLIAGGLKPLQFELAGPPGGGGGDNYHCRTLKECDKTANASEEGFQFYLSEEEEAALEEEKARQDYGGAREYASAPYSATNLQTTKKRSSDKEAEEAVSPSLPVSVNAEDGSLDLSDTAIVTMASGTAESDSGKNAVALIQSLRDHGTKARIVVLLSRGSIGSAECVRDYIQCSGPDTVENEIVDTVYLDAFKRLGAETLIIDPISSNEWLDIPSGRESGWGQSLNRLLLFGMTMKAKEEGLVKEGFRKVLWIDSDALVLSNLDHLLALPPKLFHAAQAFGCCNPAASAIPAGGLQVFEPDEETFDLLNRLWSGPPSSAMINATLWEDKWLLSDQALAQVAFSAVPFDVDIAGKAQNDEWPACQSEVHGIINGLELLPYWQMINETMKEEHFARIKSKWKLNHTGLIEERWQDLYYANGKGLRKQLSVPWEPLDVRYDVHVQNCECQPDRQPKPDEWLSIHFTCSRYTFKPGAYKTEMQFRDDVSRFAWPCTRPFYRRWLDAFKRGMGEEGLRALGFSSAGDDAVAILDPHVEAEKRQEDEQRILRNRAETGCEFGRGKHWYCRWALNEKEEEKRKEHSEQ